MLIAGSKCHLCGRDFKKKNLKNETISRIAINGLKPGNKVRHIKHEKTKWSNFTNGLIHDVSRSGKSVEVIWYNDAGQKIAMGKYDCNAVERIDNQDEI
ncbi:hypothetical protein ABER99_21755 [Paenibacillus glucanolyticus]|uniref:hypothetical protein n=1 Tax=Paenibacillus glucanolyticus TaxID=59843 RepID=UPI0013E3711E|nr:hypothetical protein [Paenibacillus glucanolyticus]